MPDVLAVGSKQQVHCQRIQLDPLLQKVTDELACLLLPVWKAQFLDWHLQPNSLLVPLAGEPRVYCGYRVHLYGTVACDLLIIGEAAA